jgi:hypothetical protein
MAKFDFSIEEVDFGMLRNSFEHDTDDFLYYLDLKENEVVMLCEYDTFPDEDQTRLKIMNDTKGRFVPLPGRDTGEDWEDMQDFAFTVDDESKRDRLLNAIQGRGAFRYFMDLLLEMGIREDWFEFKNSRRLSQVFDWLLGEKLITEEEAEQYKQQLEEEAKRRRERLKQRQQDMKNMQQGATVEYIDSSTYPGLTTGKRYRIIDERPADGLIRLKDDNSKQHWYQKTHFKLIRDK